MKIHEGAMHIESAVKFKDQQDMLQMQVGGINPADTEYYSKYFNVSSDDDVDVEEEMEHAEQIKTVLAGLKKRHGREKNTDIP